ncbi:MAG: hypothetical protein AABY37_03635 [Actinomycetota bacterium]
MVRKSRTIPTEEELVARDESDPVFKMLDDGVMSDKEIFEILGWEPMPADTFDEIQ